MSFNEALDSQISAERGLGLSPMPLINQDDWSPLVSLVRKCKGLTDFLWACENQFPRGLLAALEEKETPEC